VTTGFAKYRPTELKRLLISQRCAFNNKKIA